MKVAFQCRLAPRLHPFVGRKIFHTDDPILANCGTGRATSMRLIVNTDDNIGQIPCLVAILTNWFNRMSCLIQQSHPSHDELAILDRPFAYLAEEFIAIFCPHNSCIGIAEGGINPSECLYARLRLFALGNVAINATIPPANTLTVKKWIAATFQKNCAPVLVQIGIFQKAEWLGFLFDGIEDSLDTRRLNRWHQRKRGLADDLFDSIAKQVVHLRAGIGVHSVLIDFPDPVAGAFHQRAEL